MSNIVKSRKSELKCAALAVVNDFDSLQDYYLVKNASLTDKLRLDSWKSAISNHIKNNVNKDQPVVSLISLMAPTLLFRLNPLLFGLYLAVEKGLGVNFLKVYNSFVGRLGPKLEKGEKISRSELDQAARDAAFAGAGSISAASTSDLSLVITKQGRKGLWARLKGLFGPSMRPRNAGKIRLFFAGALAWALKTALILSGVVVGTVGVIKLYDYFKKDKPAPGKTLAPGATLVPGAGYDPTKKITQHDVQDILRTTGWGQKRFTNNSETAWAVELIYNDVDETLLNWLQSVYPAFARHMNDWNINNVASYKDIASKLDRANRINSTEIEMPIGFNSIKQVVDEFAEDAAEEVLRNIK